MPTFTVHIPCYNYRRYVAEAVESVLGQTYGDWEAIVTDDASTDGSQAVLDRFHDPRIRHIRHSRNVGHIATYNEAIAEACGEYFVILSADDRYRPRFLEAVLEAFKAHPETGLVYTNYARIDAEGRLVRYQPTMPHRGDGVYDDLANLLDHGFIAGCAAVAGTGTLRDLGGYDSRFPYTADTFLWRRIAVRAPFGYVDDRLYEYRYHGQSMSQRADRIRVLEEEHLDQFTRLFTDPSLPPKASSLQGRAYGRLYWDIGERLIRSGHIIRGFQRLMQALHEDPSVWGEQALGRRLWSGITRRTRDLLRGALRNGDTRRSLRAP